MLMNKRMELKTRIIAFYLPQYYPIPENDAWWGKGFTEWHNVVRAKPLFIGHKQPHLPADLGFYDLRLSDTRIAQAKLAKEYGIDGFCYWHYWFGDDKRLLERPFTEVLNSGEPDFPFCLGWANHSWYNKDWGGKGKDKILIEQLYLGKEDYEKHFYSMLPAFKDSRYIKIENKPFFIIFDPLSSPEIKIFMQTWRKLAKANGLTDFYFVGKTADNRKKDEIIEIGCDAIYNDDVFNIHHELSKIRKVYHWMTRNVFSIPTVFDYKDAVEFMVTEKDKPFDSIPTIAPNWDHSPRSKTKGIILKNSKPELFKKLVIKALNTVKEKPTENQIIILKSWNEWGEGNYLEPDIEFGTKYLEALKEGINEFKNEI
jgi:hypothetical protein